MNAPSVPIDPAFGKRIAGAFARVRERIADATARAGRPTGTVRLLAVTKTFGTDTVAAAVASGQRDFGENYVQEAAEKMAGLRAPGRLDPQSAKEIAWHFIGPIQSNKTRTIAANFDWVQSIDRLAVAQRLAHQRMEADAARAAWPDAPLDVLLQVNISEEATKSGIAPIEVPEIADALALLPNLRLRGLMAIPQAGLAPAQQRESFARLRTLFESTRARLQRAHPGVQFDTLSMGMSDDFEAAILEGSTMVRIGSALFGARS